MRPKRTKSNYFRTCWSGGILHNLPHCAEPTPLSRRVRHRPGTTPSFAFVSRQIIPNPKLSSSPKHPSKKWLKFCSNLFVATCKLLHLLCYKIHAWKISVKFVRPSDCRSTSSPICSVSAALVQKLLRTPSRHIRPLILGGQLSKIEHVHNVWLFSPVGRPENPKPQPFQ